MDNLKLAVISTPRSGNCWLRHMLSQMYELEEVFAHRPDVVPWSSLADRMILQLHWLPEEQFRAQLAEHGFRVVVAGRHPLDVLISALVFSQHDESTARWLDGAAGNERCIAEAWPTSEEFLNYATGPRAKALLSVSLQWWSIPDVCRVRYEDLVHDTSGQLAGVAAMLGVPVIKSPENVARNATPEHLRTHSIHMLYHVWQARVGLWRKFLPAAEARRICDVHAEVLRTLGYACDPDESLTTQHAEAAWERFDIAGVKRTLHGAKQALCEAAGMRTELNGHRAALDNQLSEANRQQGELEAMRRELAELRARNSELERQLALLPVEQLRDLATVGPWSLGAARTLQNWSRTFPRISAAFKSLVRVSRRVPQRQIDVQKPG